MYFKITNIGSIKHISLGLVEVCADFFLEPGDEGYEKYVQEFTVQTSIEEFKLLSFCNHAIQFESDLLEEDVLSKFDDALIKTHQNYLKDDLLCKKNGIKVNKNINFEKRIKEYKDNPDQKKIIKAENSSKKLINTDWSKYSGKYKVKI